MNKENKSLHEVRCKDCDKLLCKIKGQVEVICPRCGKLNKDRK